MEEADRDNRWPLHRMAEMVGRGSSPHGCASIPLSILHEEGELMSHDSGDSMTNGGDSY